MNDLLRIFVRDALEEFANLYFDVEFLVQFPRQALRKGFSFMPFAAGKFPKAAQMRFGKSLRDEEFAVSKHQSCRHFDGLGLWCWELGHWVSDQRPCR